MTHSQKALKAAASSCLPAWLLAASALCPRVRCYFSASLSIHVFLPSLSSHPIQKQLRAVSSYSTPAFGVCCLRAHSATGSACTQPSLSQNPCWCLPADSWTPWRNIWWSFNPFSKSSWKWDINIHIATWDKFLFNLLQGEELTCTSLLFFASTQRLQMLPCWIPTPSQVWRCFSE